MLFSDFPYCIHGLDAIALKNNVILAIRVRRAPVTEATVIDFHCWETRHRTLVFLPVGTKQQSEPKEERAAVAEIHGLIPRLVSARRCRKRWNKTGGNIYELKKWKVEIFWLKQSTVAQHEAWWWHVMLCRCCLWRWRCDMNAIKTKFQEENDLLWLRRFVFQQGNVSNRKPHPRRSGLKTFMSSCGSIYLGPIRNLWQDLKMCSA